MQRHLWAPSGEMRLYHCLPSGTISVIINLACPLQHQPRPLIVVLTTTRNFAFAQNTVRRFLHRTVRQCTILLILLHDDDLEHSRKRKPNQVQFNPQVYFVSKTRRSSVAAIDRTSPLPPISPPPFSQNQAHAIFLAKASCATLPAVFCPLTSSKLFQSHAIAPICRTSSLQACCRSSAQGGIHVQLYFCADEAHNRAQSFKRLSHQQFG